MEFVDYNGGAVDIGLGDFEKIATVNFLYDTPTVDIYSGKDILDYKFLYMVTETEDFAMARTVMSPIIVYNTLRETTERPLTLFVSIAEMSGSSGISFVSYINYDFRYYNGTLEYANDNGDVRGFSYNQGRSTTAPTFIRNAAPTTATANFYIYGLK